MTPREPERFEAKAREIVDLFVTTGTHVTEMRSSLAAALRAEHANAIEWVAVNLYGGHHAAAIRALASPAAAPAAEGTRCQCIIGAVAASCVYATPDRPCECSCHAPPSEPVAPEKAQSLTKEESHGEQADRGGVREGSRAVDGDQAREGSDLAQVGDRRGVDGALLGPERGSKGPRSGQRQGDVGGSGGGRFSAYGVAPPAPLLPRVLAALEWVISERDDSEIEMATRFQEIHVLAAELRAYIKETK